MLGLPDPGCEPKRIPKEAFLRGRRTSPSVKRALERDVERINVEHALRADELDLSKNAKIAEIDVFSIKLRNLRNDDELFETIAKRIPRPIVLALLHPTLHLVQLAVYRADKLRKSRWTSLEETRLELRGSNLDRVWDGFAEQIAIPSPRAKNVARLSLDDRIRLEDQIEKLELQTKRVKSELHREKQPKKKFDLHREWKRLERELDEMIEGKDRKS